VAAWRTRACSDDGEGKPVALTGGYHAAFLVGASSRSSPPWLKASSSGAILRSPTGRRRKLAIADPARCRAPRERRRSSIGGRWTSGTAPCRRSEGRGRDGGVTSIAGPRSRQPGQYPAGARRRSSFPSTGAARRPRALRRRPEAPRAECRERAAHAPA
jgi:hypothetical protein